MRKLFVIIAATALSLTHLCAQTIKVQAPKVVAVGEQFNVVFTIEGENKVSDFYWDCGSSLSLVWGPQTGSSTSISIINGHRTTNITKSYTYIVEARTEGVITLPTAVVTVKGDQWVSEDVKIEVVSSERPSQAQSGGTQPSQSVSQAPSRTSTPTSSGDISDSDVYLKMSLSRSDVVVGEPVTVTIKLYNSGYNLTNLEDVKLPDFNGFWSQDITPEGNIQFERENVGGYIMNTALIKKYVIIPQKAGSIAIDPAEMVCRIDVRRYNNTGSIFDGFFDDYVTIRKRVVTPARTLTVKQLPTPSPASFYGGTGRFSVDARLSQSNIATHEAASLFLTVSGKGNISLLETPKVSFPPDFEVYDVKAQEKIDKVSGEISGTKTYEFPFIPRSHGDFTIEPIKYTYYDIDKHEYVTLSTSPIPIHVERGDEIAPGTVGTVTPVVGKKGVKNLSEDIRYIYTKPDAMGGEFSFFVFSAAFWICLAALFAAAVLVWFIVVSLRARRSDVVGAKVRKASKMALSRLRTANEYLGKNLHGAFYEELHKALLGFVGDKFNMKAAELSHEGIASRLRGCGIDDNLIGDLTALLSACDEARYSPGEGFAAMRQHYDKAVETITAIDSSMKHNSSAGKAVRMLASAFLVSAGLAAAPDAGAQSYADSLWTRACDEYTAGNWEEALEGFENISAIGFESAQLEYNLGNAYFKTYQYGKAILHYERALKIDPSYEDAKYNILIAKEFTLDDIESVPEFVLKTWLRKFSYSTSSDGWTVWFFILLAATLAMILLFVLGRSSVARRIGFFSAIVLVLLSIQALSFAASQKSDWMKADSAIVLRPVSSVKSSPSSDSASDIFVLHEGTKVQILDNVGQWSSIRISDGRKGWIQTRDIEVI